MEYPAAAIEHNDGLNRSFLHLLASPIIAVRTDRSALIYKQIVFPLFRGLET